jgi:hypothetical protein
MIEEWIEFETCLKHGYMYMSFCVVLSCVSRRLGMGESLIQRNLPKYLKGFIASEVKSESAQGTGSNL